MLWPVVAFWTIALLALRGPSVGLVYALFAAMPFGALAVVPPALLGGLTLTPTSVVAALLVARCLGTADGRRWFAYALRSVEHFVPLLGFWAVAVVTTLVSPTLFGGRVEVVPLRGDALDPGATAPLAPSLQQASQLGYVTLSVFVVIAAARLLGRERTRGHVLRAMMLGGSVTVLTGSLDRLLAGGADPLGPLRTANYAIAARWWDGPLAERPLAGLMPDPNGFGALCVMFVATLWFHRRSVRERWLRAVFVPWLCVLLGVMVWLSASPLAWTGLAIVVVAGAAEASWRAVRPRVRACRRRRTPSGARRFVLLSLTVLALFAGSAPVYDRAAELAARFVPAAAMDASASVPDRAELGTVSIRSALDTWGLGVGVGGTRAPGWFLGLLSGVGVLGTLCCVGFVAATWAWRPSRRRTEGRTWMAAYRWSVPCIAAVVLAGGGGADFGPYLALLFGSSVALQRGSRVERLLQSDDAAAAQRRRARDAERLRAREAARLEAARGAADPAGASTGAPTDANAGAKSGPPAPAARPRRRRPARIPMRVPAVVFDVGPAPAFELGEPDPPRAKATSAGAGAALPVEPTWGPADGGYATMDVELG